MEKYNLYLGIKKEFEVIGPIPRVGDKIAWNADFYTIVNIHHVIIYSTFENKTAHINVFAN